MDASFYNDTFFFHFVLACRIRSFVYRILEPSLMIDIKDSKTLSDIGEVLA